MKSKGKKKSKKTEHGKNWCCKAAWVEEGSDFIQKPFNAETLARRVRAALQQN